MVVMASVISGAEYTVCPKKWRVKAGCLLGHFKISLIPWNREFRENQNKNNNKKAELTGEQHPMLVAKDCLLREAGVERERDCRNSA